MRGKRIAFTGLCTLALASGLAPAETITSVGTTGVYDSTDATNAIDVDAAGSSLDAFKIAVAAAYAHNTGGVIDWETKLDPTPNASVTTAANNSLTAVTALYGTSGTQALTLTFDQAMALYTNNINNQVQVTSGSGDLHNAVISASAGFTLTFSGPSVTEIGATLLSRTSYGSGVTATVTAHFSDSSTAQLSSVLTNSAGATDTFFHFAAPAGLSISSVSFSPTGDGTSLQNRLVLDDLGFILGNAAAAPTPSALAGGAALLGLVAVGRRRR